MAKAKRGTAELEITFKKEREAKAVHNSLKPEELLPASARCKAVITRRKNVLCIEIDANDTAALRAALNSFLRWTMVARDAIKAGRD
jgi:tRNA threonylcarbamoyladenosine modification (KEOPS) complex  Pcc1 subunit